MIKALLTIDDIASENTPAIVDFLVDKGIPAIMFAWGENVERYPEAAVYALKNGIIVGNHSYSHPQFSELSFDECKAEIEKENTDHSDFHTVIRVEIRRSFFRSICPIITLIRLMILKSHLHRGKRADLIKI